MKAIALTLAFYMLLGSLFPQADFSQLPKVIFAFKHFQQHVQEEAEAGRSVSFWKFAELHFFQPSEHGQGHQQEHSQLPLHSVGQVFSAVELHQLALPFFVFVQNSSTIRQADQTLDLAGFSLGIFRPPVC